MGVIIIKSPTVDSKIIHLQASLADVSRQILQHELYHWLRTADDLRLFMEYHVFAVWDFMSLAKSLQIGLTCVWVPWIPTQDPNTRRLINEIVLAEESDEHPDGGYTSHFELYLDAMRQAGADTESISVFLSEIRNKRTLEAAFKKSKPPDFVTEFLQTTSSFVQSGNLHEIAAVFTFGREEIIPQMFEEIVRKINQEYDGKFDLFQKYLERHIHLDGTEHKPLALRLVSSLCGEDEKKWKEAERAALKALLARKALWDGIVDFNTSQS